MSQPVQLVVFGGQGSGKGTQAAALAARLDLELIGTGDILRKMATEQTPIGRKVNEIISAGQLVPDDMISEIITLQLKSLPGERGFVLEGYPRTIRQAEELEAASEASGRSPEAMTFVYLDVPREELIKRLLARGRHDDTEELIDERLRLYDEKTAPVLKAVEAWANVIHVDGDQPVEAVTESIIKELEHAKAQA
jgi:adenylate kinase